MTMEYKRADRTMEQKAKHSIAVAQRQLREKAESSTLVERYFLLDDAWRSVEGLPQPLQLGKGLYYVLSRASLPIEPYDLLLGRFDDHVPTPAEEERIWQIVRERGLHLNPITAPNGGHLTIDSGLCIREGLCGLYHAAIARLETAVKTGESESTQQFLEGMVWVWRAILCYVERYSAEASRLGAQDLAEVCRRLTVAPPATFREGLQLVLFLYDIYLIYAGRAVACLNVGRLDDVLLPLYRADVAAGRIDESAAGALIDDFSAKMNLHLGRGEHQMANPAEGGAHTGWERNPVYDSPGYITLGGYSNHGDHRENELTLLFARHIHPGLKNPIYICRFTAQTPDALWEVLCDRARQNASLLLYNDETVIPAHRHIGVLPQHANDYSVHPCNWADIGGGSAIVGDVGGSIPFLLNEALGALRDRPCVTVEEIYDALADGFAEQLRPLFAQYRARYGGEQLPEAVGLSLDDCLQQGPLERGRGQREGGVRYAAIYVLLRNIGTAADMMSAVEQLVVQRHVCTLDALLRAAENNFEQQEALLALCRRAPKFGCDDMAADTHAVRLLQTLLDVVDAEATNERGERDVYTLNVTINDMNHRHQGNGCATVDGRLRGTPLSENMSPTVGCVREATALLNSVARLPAERLHSGALNLRLRREMVRSDAGLARLRALIEGYFRMGGMQLQISIADTDELRAAQANPEAHRDLTVRITGYSAVFVDMSPGAQEEIIRRDELG